MHGLSAPPTHCSPVFQFYRFFTELKLNAFAEIDAFSVVSNRPFVPVPVPLSRDINSHAQDLFSQARAIFLSGCPLFRNGPDGLHALYLGYRQQLCKNDANDAARHLSHKDGDEEVRLEIDIEGNKVAQGVAAAGQEG